MVLVAAVTGAVLLVTKGGGKAQADTSSLRTVAVRTGDVTAEVTADGTVEAVSEVAANFATTGTIRTLGVSVGSTVSRGQVIATLQTAALTRAVKVARLQYSAARESLDSAEAGTTTTDPATKKTTTTVDDAQVANANAQVVQAQATLEDAKAALAAATLKAPISGTVLQVNGKVGSTSGASSSGSSSASSGSGAAGTGGTGTTSSSDLVVIANMSALQVSISVPESDIGKLAAGKTARITFPAMSGVSTTGKITNIDPAGTTANSVVTFGVVVRLDTVPKGLRLGQSASVTITTSSATNALLVPSTAVTTNGSVSTLTLLKKNADGTTTAQRTRVQVGVVGTSFTQVTSGVAAGDEVVLTSATTSTSSSTSPFGGRSGFGGGFGGGAGQGGPAVGAP